MSRVTRPLIALLAVLSLVLLAPPARAADPWKITRHHTTVQVEPTGTAHVSVDFDFDFGTKEGHGPIVALIERQEVANDPDVWRMIDITEVQASSPNASAKIDTESDDGVLLIRIGDEDEEVTGVRSYTLSYTVRGLIAADHATSGLDEVNFSAIGTQWEVPIANVSASVTGPVPVQQTACFYGRSFSEPCEASFAGDTATFSAPDLAPGNGLQIVAGFPAGTFTDAAPRFEKRFHPGNTFAANPATLGTAGVVTLAGLVFVVGGWLRRRRDEVYVGLTPGLAPAPGQGGATTLTSKPLPVTVQFTPPKGVGPGEIGVLQDGTANNTDVTATILDLAARGHFQIVQEGKKDWRFQRRADARDDLSGSERFVMKTLFQSGDSVTTDDLKDKKYADLMTGAKERLDGEVKKRGWFRSDLGRQRAVQFVVGLLLLLGGVGATIALAATVGWGLPGLALAVVGLLGLVMAFGGRGRSADGSAVMAQAAGFKQYLTTAEADQIRFEEGIDVFSRYLPYATVFGVADRWAKVFEQLAAEGRYTPTDWYVGYGPMNGFYFASAMNSLTSQIGASMVSSVAANTATSATSGGSGFSGGGGFGGGGGGGW
ncbi:DUF2207 domain-containing protein [Propioniciclava coleopterorum]|uniref:DUF2207 domain-containing protein n=1 Tax=Propioniciclava coleopterorum TaxID=2714937 RepID=A0A6G7Y543_9ACTN|nr:DUF2207 domain-containing protein [Propioniciclava coleopterorum]QIK71786.1 DUF2207 domain-containing protein [Propioniciclava coleopterorum]